MEDTAQRDELISGHVALVGHLVRETINRLPAHVHRDDLSSAGLAALVSAGHAYDPSRGVPFARYASTRIRGAILDELRGSDWATRSVRRRARDLDETRARLSGELGHPASDAEVGSALGLSAAEIESNRVDVARASLISLNGLPDDSIDDLLPRGGFTPEQILLHGEQIAYLRAAILELPERLHAVVHDYYFDEQPMAEIAARLGVTESRVSQIRAEALALLRGALDHVLESPAPSAAPERGCAARRRQAYFTAVAARHPYGRRNASLPVSA